MATKTSNTWRISAAWADPAAARRRLLAILAEKSFRLGDFLLSSGGRSACRAAWMRETAGEDTGGVHGANRLGGNGVANSTVFGGIAGDTIAGWTPGEGELVGPDEAGIEAAGGRGASAVGRAAKGVARPSAGADRRPSAGEGLAGRRDEAAQASGARRGGAIARRRSGCAKGARTRAAPRRRDASAPWPPRRRLPQCVRQQRAYLWVRSLTPKCTLVFRS